MANGFALRSLTSSSSCTNQDSHNDFFIKAEWFITPQIYIFFTVIVFVFALITTVPGAPEVFVQQAGGSIIVLSWDLKCKNGIITKYTVAYFIVDDNSNKAILSTSKTELRIEKLVPGKTYEFQVKNGV